jgi:hypothetical protein
LNDLGKWVFMAFGTSAAMAMFLERLLPGWSMPAWSDVEVFDQARRVQGS